MSSNMFFDVTQTLDEFERALEGAWGHRSLTTRNYSTPTNRTSQTPAPVNRRSVPTNPLDSSSPWARHAFNSSRPMNRSQKPMNGFQKPTTHTFRSMDRPHPSPLTKNKVLFPAMDVWENDNQVLLAANVPGFSKETLKLVVHEQSVILSGENHINQEQQKKNYRRRERHSGQFTRTIQLPCEVDPTQAQVSYQNGVVHVVLDKVRQPSGCQYHFMTDDSSFECESENDLPPQTTTQTPPPPPPPPMPTKL